MEEENLASSTGLSAKDRKRKWFKEKYSQPGDGNQKSKPTSCKFFATTGRCRNGDRCTFIHSKASEDKLLINQPCRFLYTVPFRCSKGGSCHFSHDLSSFPCPHLNSGSDNCCVPLCKFNHSPLVNEFDRMRFVETFHSFLQSRDAATPNPTWSFYLKEYSEEDVWNAITRIQPSNYFSVHFGCLGPAVWGSVL